MLLPVLALAGLLGLVAGLAVYLFMQQKQQASGANDDSAADATAAAPRVRRLLAVLVALFVSCTACWLGTQRGTPPAVVHMSACWSCHDGFNAVHCMCGESYQPHAWAHEVPLAGPWVGLLAWATDTSCNSLDTFLPEHSNTA
jgi:hypothetical protein